MIVHSSTMLMDALDALCRARQSTPPSAEELTCQPVTSGDLQLR